LRKALGILFIIFCFAWAFIAFNADEATEPDSAIQFIADNLDRVRTYYEASPFFTILGYCAVIFASAVVGLPPPGLVTITGAALFGFLPAVVISLPMTILGALIPFSLSRTILGPLIKKKFPTQLTTVQNGLSTDGAWYLFSLRLVPLVPFPLVNLLMGLTVMEAKVFAAVSFVGRIPLTLLYCHAGLQLGSIKTTSDIFTPQVLTSLLAVAVFPHIARMLLKLRAYPGGPG